MTYDAYDIEIWYKSIRPILVCKRPSGPQQSHPSIQFWLKNSKKIKMKKNASEIFTYQKGLGSKILFCEMFLKLNFTSKYIWGIILYFFQEAHRTLLVRPMKTPRWCCLRHLKQSKSARDSILAANIFKYMIIFVDVECFHFEGNTQFFCAQKSKSKKLFSYIFKFEWLIQ
jgi:hypothetical protein